MSVINSKTSNLPSSEVLFTLKRKAVFSDTNNNNESKEVTENSNINDYAESDQPDTILCVLWKNSKMGAAYYKISDKQVGTFLF